MPNTNNIKSNNKSIYKPFYVTFQVFNCIPCDSVRSFQQLYDYQAGHQMAVNEPDKAREQLSKVKGHVVLMSLHFLADESDLSASLGTKEALAPTVVWT